MKAMIFAAGIGSRLKPITDSLPKALVEIAGKTLLERVVERLKNAGCEHIVVNVHHFGGLIIDFLKAHNNFGIDIRVSDERACLLDTGGGVRKAIPLLEGGEPVLIHNVDILSNVDLAKLYDDHVRSGADVSLLVSERETQRYLLFDAAENNRLVGWTNIATGEVKSPYKNLSPDKYHRLAFSGIHVISPRVFDLMCGYPEKFPIMDFYLKEADKLNIVGRESADLQMVDVGKLYAIGQAENFVKSHPE